jgi:sterol desaturase/sphingolipid hydroxylase (fatty acid hydroxylase superfamily)
MLHEMPVFLRTFAQLSLWLVLLVTIFIPLERIFAVRRQKILRPAFLQDLGLYFLNGLISATLLSIPLAAAVAVAYAFIPEGFYDFIDALPLWFKLALTFIIGDFGFYWGHRWSHELPLLWRFHSLHHQPTGLDWLVNTRAHPVDIVFTRLCGLVPVYMLGLGRPGSDAGNIGPILLTIVGTFWSFFIHANLRCHLRWLEQVISSPHFHHWHHTRDDHINHNYAPMLPIFDRLFGTLHLPATWPAHYGVASSVDMGRPASPPELWRIDQA